MGLPIHVLIIEDSEEDAALLVRELQRGGYEPSWERVETSEAMRAALDRQNWDILLADFTMPNFDGLSALKLLRDTKGDKPFIFVSGTIGEDTAVEAMRTGASDYIMKNNLKRLLPAVERELRESQIRGAQRDAEEMIHRMAFYDPVTNLPNRTFLFDRLLNTIRTNTGQGRRSALVLIDLDRFHEINDTLGFSKGDDLLGQVGRRLREAIFERDFVAHLGGDEFAVLIVDLKDVADIELVWKRIWNALNTSFIVENLPVRIEASLGISLFPDHGEAADVLFQRAAIALHASKESGSNYTVYRPEEDKHDPKHLALMAELHHAIEGDELLLFYQPSIDMKTRGTIGAEALVRWKHPDRGMVPPNQFILPAERTGLIHPLTRWVVKTANQQCRALHRAGMPLTISVNLSARNLSDPKLPAEISEQLLSEEVDPGCIRFEITESAIMANPDGALEVMTRIHDAGFRFSIDDFGTGYSSLNYLKKLPVDTLKIDRTFVMNVVEDSQDAAIVDSTISLAHNLGLKVVAEGIENEGVWDRLCALGCDEAQGYYMAKPMPAGELTRWLEESPWGIKPKP